MLFKQFVLAAAKLFKKFLAVDGLHCAGFQVVISAVEHVPRLHHLVEISGQCILQKLVGSASTLTCEVIKLLFNVWGKMYFHVFKVREKPGVRQPGKRRKSA